MVMESMSIKEAIFMKVFGTTINHMEKEKLSILKDVLILETTKTVTCMERGNISG